ncbi:MAG: dipeptidase [Gaiellaceae bacterium]
MRILDGHNDALLALRRAGAGPEGFLDGGVTEHLDLPRARAGGFAGGFFAVYVPGDAALEELVVERPGGWEIPPMPALDPDYAHRFAEEQIELLFAIEAASGGAVRVVRTAAELAECVEGEAVGAILHLEGAEPLDPELRRLEPLHERGLRSIGPVWSRPNAFGEGVPFRIPSSPDTGPGLTAAGRELVQACNRLRIVLDLSHLNERGFREVAGLTDAPLVVTHAGAHAVCPHSRNLVDGQLDLIRDSGGVVGVVFDVPMTSPDGGRDPATPLDVLVRHVDHLAERMGIDHVALGSDFDGAMMPADLRDAAGLPRLLDALRAAGYREADLAAIANGNWLRVLRATWGA